MNKLILITTEGCEGCVIARNNIRDAIKETKKEINFVIKDVNEIDKKLIKQLRITDYPATLFFKDNELRYKAIGTYPSIVILRWVDIHFK